MLTGQSGTWMTFYRTIMSGINRPLGKGINWDAETIELQNIDWKGSEQDFRRLLSYVKAWLVKKEVGSEDELFTYVSKEELEAMVRQAAGEYEDRFASLAFWCFQRAKFFVRRRMNEHFLKMFPVEPLPSASEIA